MSRRISAMPVPPFKRLLSSALAAAVLVGVSTAGAQTITLQQAGMFYRQQPLRPIGQQPHWINRADCLAKDVIHFPVFLTNFGGLTLQVWAGNQGTDCTPANQRQPGGSAECWLVSSEPAVVQNPMVLINAIDLVARILPSDTNPSGTVVPHGTYPDACTNSAAPAGQQLTLTFMFVSGGTTIVGTPVTWTDIGYDVTPPASPTAVEAEAGETRAHISFTPNPASDVISYEFFCDPPRNAVVTDGGLATQGPPLGLQALGDGGSFGTGGDFGAGGSFGLGGAFGSGGLTGAGGTTGFDTGGFGGTVITGGAGGVVFGAGGFGGTAGLTGGGTAGVVGTAGAAGATEVSTVCSGTSKLQPATDPTFPNPLDDYVCGSVGKSAHDGVADHLVNNVDYTIAVAAVDKVGNVGPLSGQACVTPQEITDFFELYRQAGGKAGGGICSLSRRPSPDALRFYAAAGMLAVAGLGLRLRRRQK
jgi:hypothetical protein